MSPCSDLSAAEALHLAAVPREEAGAAAALSLLLGVRTALDFQLIDAGGAEAEELLLELKAGGVSVGNRAKVRLLLGQGASDGSVPDGSQATGAPFCTQSLPTRQWRRVLQAQESADEPGGVSMDTVAIVLSVLLGAAG
eukprot:SAG31_NODE_8523_length_1436_cov_37.333583_1_plen_139_part_00